MNVDAWPLQYRAIFENGVRLYREGKRGASQLFTASDKKFLDGIGCSLQEIYDFVEDLVNYGEPSYETALLITAVRRDYFLVVQKGVPSTKVVSMDDLPPKTQEVDGIAWLPRLIEKARIKLRGEMPADLMYGCGGDRPFAQKMNFDLADFLRVVWSCREDNAAIVQFVKTSAAKGSLEGFRSLGGGAGAANR